MKTYAVITSMDDAYYQKVGRACIESFGAHWPGNIHLYVFDEGIVDPPKRKWVTYLPWESLGPEFVDFCVRNTGNRTQTFAKKAFSVMAGLDTIDVDRLIWLDADVITTYSINTHLLDMITPDDVLSTHYGVLHNWPSETDPNRLSFSCETGFFVVNRRHPQFDSFAQCYKEYYVKDIVQTLRRFYDGEVYGAVVNEFERLGTKMMELNPERRHKTPIPRSVMAPYIMHYKAGAKDYLTSEQLLAKHNITNEDSSISSISAAK
jgi:hypothetical protein